MMVYCWLALTIVFVIVEAVTAELVSVWFIGGALAAMVCALLHTRVLVQAAVFVLVSALLLALLRPALKKLLHVKPTRTNADRLLGQSALVIEEIDNLQGTGAIRVGGVLWTAKNLTDEPIKVGARVTIERIEGAKVYVTPETIAEEAP